MFGYIMVHKPELRFREFDVYRSFYCGFCQSLKERHGRVGQMTLSYDLTFLTLLLTSLYEPETLEGECRCAAHPLSRHPVRKNEFSDYAADMNLLLSYYKCQDDWLDERRWRARAMEGLLAGKARKVEGRYPRQAAWMRERMEQIHGCERSNSDNIDQAAGLFGDIMAEIFVARPDAWEKTLRRMGFFLGKFIYLMDAYEDVEKDKKNGNYNPFLQFYGTEGFEGRCATSLSLMMAECSQAFEKLPLVEHVEILRNILYAGVWGRYELVRRRREGESRKNEQRMIWK